MMSGVSITSADAVYGSTRAKTVSPSEPAEGTGGGSLNVLISSRLERLAAQIGAASDTGTYGSQREFTPDTVGASELRYSPAGESGDVDYGDNVDTVGGAFDTIERVESALRQMGREGVLAQANQLPRGAMS